MFLFQTKLNIKPLMQWRVPCILFSSSTFFFWTCLATSSRCFACFFFAFSQCTVTNCCMSVCTLFSSGSRTTALLVARLFFFCLSKSFRPDWKGSSFSKDLETLRIEPANPSHLLLIKWVSHGRDYARWSSYCPMRFYCAREERLLDCNNGVPGRGPRLLGTLCRLQAVCLQRLL